MEVGLDARYEAGLACVTTVDLQRPPAASSNLATYDKSTVMLVSLFWLNGSENDRKEATKKANDLQAKWLQYNVFVVVQGILVI